MDHYVEVHLMPDPEFPQSFLMNALLGKLHRALVTNQHHDIGISFPVHKEGSRKQTLGDTLRLHGLKLSLVCLMDSNWLQGMYDHVTVENCQPIPNIKGYRTVHRKQFKTNAERLRRRRASRHDETMEQARERIPDSIERQVALPYAHITSTSTKQRFCLFITHGPLQNSPTAGEFNAYGLSRIATIPWF